MWRKILHIDLDAFFCAVEELQQPALRGKPFAVGGKPAERGVVSSCSYAARAHGVHSAMPMGQALKVCPGLIVVAPHYAEYRRVSHQVMDLLQQITPLFEQVSIDEAFLEISDLPEAPVEVARKLQAEINTGLHLPCSIGVATNKLVAKIANDVGKSRNRGLIPPNTITLVPPGEEALFLADLPVIALLGVGPKTSQRMEQMGIIKVGDLAALGETELVEKFGKHGHDLYRSAHGIDDSPVFTHHETKSISQETTFARDLTDGKRLRQVLQELAEGVGKRLRAHGLKGKTVKLKLRWYDFKTLTRQVTLAHPTDQDGEIFTAGEQLFNQNWPPGKAVRLIGLGVSGLDNLPYQLSFWDATPERTQKLQQAIDELRQRYGADAIQRGGHFVKEEG
jgi:DNA polymerase-4